MCSGGDQTLKSTEASQAQFTTALQSAFTTQFQNQTGILNYLKAQLEPMISNPTGYSPAALAALKSRAIEGTATNYGNAAKTVNAQIAARGGSALPSGVNAQIQEELAAGAASDESQGLNSIALSDEQLKQSNYWNAVQALSGGAAMLNPTGYAGEASGAANSTANLGQAFQSSKQSQIMGVLGGVVGGLASG